MSKAPTTLIIAELHSDSRAGRKVIKSLTKHDNCCNYYQYLHSTLSAFSQGTVLSQLSMLFFNEFDSFNIRTTFASVLHSSSLKTTGETNICSKSSQTCQDTSKCEQLQDTRWHQLTSIVFPSRYLPVGTLTSKKKHHSGCEVSPQPTIVIIRARIQSCLTQRAARTVQYGQKKK